jgi:hypothetical protein
MCFSFCICICETNLVLLSLRSIKHVQLKLHLAIPSSHIFDPSVHLTKLHATPGLSVTYNVNMFSHAILFSHILLFMILAFDNIMKSKNKCKSGNEANESCEVMTLVETSSHHINMNSGRNILLIFYINPFLSDFFCNFASILL